MRSLVAGANNRAERRSRSSPPHTPPHRRTPPLLPGCVVALEHSSGVRSTVVLGPASATAPMERANDVMAPSGPPIAAAASDTAERTVQARGTPVLSASLSTGTRSPTPARDCPPLGDDTGFDRLVKAGGVWSLGAPPSSAIGKGALPLARDKAFSQTPNALAAMATKLTAQGVLGRQDTLSSQAKGLYTLLIQLRHNIVVWIGSLGPLAFSQGMYVYTGSARGSGAASLPGRLARHFRPTKNCHWHIDYLLANAGVIVRAACCALTERDDECRLNREISRWSQGSIRGFGAGDCHGQCGGHLARLVGGDARAIIQYVNRSFRRLRLEPRVILSKQ